MISRGDILRAWPPSQYWLPLYQGNGRFGCCYGPWGLHARPHTRRDYRLHGATQFMHLKHFIRAAYNADYLVPLALVYWKNEPNDVQDYEQHQSFYDGTITTRFECPDYSVCITSWFDPVRRDIAGYQIDVQGDAPVMVIAPFREVPVRYGEPVKASFTGTIEEGIWKAEISCLKARSSIKVKTTGQMKQVGEGLEIGLNQGRNHILLAVNEDIKVSGEESLGQTTQWWHRTWENTAWLDLPDETAQKVWVRSMAYVLYSQSDDPTGCAPPCGYTGNAWPFPFLIDSGCRHPLLLRSGHVAAAHRWIEHWHKNIEGMKRLTQRMVKADGIWVPHVFSYGPLDGFHDPAPPNEFYYPTYNSGFLVRMVHETAVMLNDPEWRRTYAIPFIREAARFYVDRLKKGGDGLWHLYIAPSIGLDELGGRNQRDYLGGLYAAKYTLQKAIEYGLDKGAHMQEILNDGLAFGPLLSEQGLYYANAGSGVKDFGKQKHAPQLMPLFHIPSDSCPDEPAKKAYASRYDITNGARRPLYSGHTLGEFLLSSARMHDVQGWRKDWCGALPASLVDPEWIQFYESSRWHIPFYVTTHALFAQAMLETVVSTWWSRLDLAGCVPWKGSVRFGNVRTLLGVTVDGQVTDGQGEAVLRAWKDTSFECGGRTITVQKGGKVTVIIKEH
ncbi:MAG: hypothetical protein ACYTA5_14170 [Planctomycetota bacterium]